MNFAQFLAAFPAATNHEPLVPGATGGLRYVAEGLPEFVGPDLAPSNEIQQPSHAQIVIVSASGAAGKSTLANELALAKKVAIWDLALAEAVGANSMAGQLIQSFGPAGAAKIYARIAAGETFFVIDALDEATMKSNEAGFDAFIRNIATIASTSAHTSFVLFARTQTARDTWLILDDAGIPTSLLAIQPFNREQAERYIDARIKHDKDPSAAKRIQEHRQPFVAARDAILQQLERAVVGDDATAEVASREFLGYAPVLETVAVLLAKEKNPHELLTGLQATTGVSTSDRPLLVLEHVVTRLLRREQVQKVQHNIRPALESTAAAVNWSSWDTLYSEEEQRLRLLGRILQKIGRASCRERV